MKNGSFSTLQLLILICTVLFFSRAYAQDQLQNGIPLNTSLPSFNYRNFYIDVPSGATRLTATITNGSGELDLFMKLGEPVSGNNYQELVADSDFRSDVLNMADESISVTPQDNPPLQQGRWYVAPVNFNETETGFTITATFEAPTGGGGNGGGNGGGIADQSGDGTARLNLEANDGFMVPWGGLRVTYDIKAFKSEARADLYVALLQDNGSIVFLNENFGLSTTEAPFARNILVADGEYLIYEGEQPGSPLHGAINVYAVLSKVGASPLKISNWMSNLSSVLLTFNSTSSDQYKILDERGTPSFLRIEFIRDRKIKKETWVYPGSQTYTFQNGALQSFPDSTVPAIAGEPRGKLKPVNLDEILFYPTTTMEEVRNKYGDPDRVLVSSESGIKIWIFQQAGIKITTKDGLISVIEVH